jgi:deoxyribodipyrimidine photo-lyase
VLKGLKGDSNVKEVEWITPGERAANKALNKFLAHGIKNYALERNDPNLFGQSELSPYFHFGHLSAQRAAFQASLLSHSDSRESFMEELIVRRELADNFCFYNPHYDSTKGFPAWAKKTLDEHRGDEREYLYSLKELETGKTHDELWNAAQLEMVCKGKMHNYMRMYWAKKILEWTQSPEIALKYTIYLNDKYELDGRDPSGYVGAAWSIGGVHDRAWGERKIFGKIRYMSYNGAKGKFKIQQYIDRVNKLAGKTLL